ncbi:MAG: redoxin family protein [Candidatus Eisenbacteria bacterium]|nr:redoxin family protein [Candidatus Eisenbacteria bacterium]
MLRTISFFVLFFFAAALPGPAEADDAERIAFYTACAEPDPGARIVKMAAYLENHPSAERSDQVRTMLFGVVASGAWREGVSRVDPSRVASIVSREGDAYVRAEDGADRILLLSEAYLRAGIRTAEARDLALRGGALAESMARPDEMPIASWGRMKKERLARSNYLAALALAAEGDHAAAARSFRKAESVFSGDPRFREEYARSLEASGEGKPGEWTPDERSAAAEAIAEPDRAARIREYEGYLRSFPSGARAVEIGIRLVEDYAKTSGRASDAAAAADRTAAARQDDPEVLSALALLLADAGVVPDRAAGYGERAVRILEEIVRNPATGAEDLPGLHANLLLARDAYGWALLKAGRNREALEQLKEAAKSEFPEVQRHYGAALLESGNSFDATDPLVNAAFGGADEAWAALDQIRAESSGLRAHVDDLVLRAEESLRRRKLADEKVRPAPDLSLVAADGSVANLSEWKGRVVVLVFWATWCEPCTDALARIESARKRYGGKDVRFLAVNTDRDIWLVRPFLDDQKIETTTVFTAGEKDWEEKARAFEIGALPAILVLDRRGNVRYAETESETSGRILEKVLSWRIDKLLAER